MTSNCGETRRWPECVLMLAGLMLALMPIAPRAGAQTQPADQKPAEPKSLPETYQTLYLTNVNQQREINDVVTDLRNVLPRAKLYAVQSQNAVSFRGTADDLALAQKVLADLDRLRMVNRLTYTVTEMDGDKRIGTQHFALTAVSGTRTTLKLGSRVPIVTGSFDTASLKQDTQVQYQDVGLSIEASLDGLSLHTKIEQTSPAEERSGVGTQDPIIRQTVLDATATLAAGKPLVLGSLDIPGSTRHEEIEVVAELVP